MKFHEGAMQGGFDVHRTYGYEDFSIELDAETTDGICGGKVLSMPVGYVVVRISSGASPATIQPLRFVRNNGRPFATEAEPLMRGYGAAQRIIDDMIAASTLRPTR
ncbi:hypothetical protein [Paraburkholderia elongata]|uniref:hypothetical protein n=1 Tax=Paraburkholderia elongata TaxID=2675747 RepID=UPI0015522355|nr:hypothetical protein [Paraburkholderia elongata]